MDNIIESIESYLYDSSTDAKRAWHARIANTGLRVVGGGVPMLRRIARELIERNLAGEMINLASTSSEEILLLRGLLIAYDRVDESCTLTRLDRYLDDVDNWECIDTIASSIKYNDAVYRDYLISKLDNDNIWHIRYGVVGLLDNYLRADTLANIRAILTVKRRSYYVDMAMAWAISVAYVYDARATLIALDEVDLTPNIIKYAIGKVRDSYRVSDEAKLAFREHMIDKIK